MPGALYTLLWSPSSRAIEATRFAERPLPSADAVVLHRRHAPNLAMAAAYAEVGVDLLPPYARPSAGAGVRLLWLPILPSRCLLVAREAAGVVRVSHRPEPARDRELSDVLIDLEVACGGAFDEAFHTRHPDRAALASRLAAAHELAVDVIGRFAVHASPPQLWSPGRAAPTSSGAA